jgi:hypothetical protein
MGKTKLDPGLLRKIVNASGKPQKYIREQISRRARGLGVSSLAAQLLWARSLNIGIAHALNRADQNVKDEVRDTVRSSSSTPKVPVSNTPSKRNAGSSPQRKEQSLNAKTVNFLLQDVELRARCRDLILARSHHDRVLREATTVLEDRVKKMSGVTNLTSVPLIGKALNPEPTRAVIVVSDEKEEQSGIFYICNGVMQAFRNKTHHNLSDAFTQADALKFCGFVDTILSVVGKGQVHSERI